jgi:hypothetical protein
VPAGHTARLGRVACGLAVAALAVVTPHASAADAKAPVPPSLTDVESAAEDLVDAALEGSRGDVLAKAAELKSGAHGSVTAALRAAGVTAAEVAVLGARANSVARVAQRGAFVTVALASNSVSALMPDLYAHFQGQVPPAVYRLDYLDREAQLRSLARQPRKVASSVRDLGSTWAGLRRKIVAAGGAKQAAAYSAHVSAMNRLERAGGARLRAEAVRGLALVDELEQVFTG